MDHGLNCLNTECPECCLPASYIYSKRRPHFLFPESWEYSVRNKYDSIIQYGPYMEAKVPT